MLTVRLEPLPHPIDKPAVKPQPPIPITILENDPTTKINHLLANSMKEMRKSAATRQFPKHLQLNFTIFSATEASNVGDNQYLINIDGEEYNLQSIRLTKASIGLVKSDRLIQTSKGIIGENGLQPEYFEEEKIKGNEKITQEIRFDWAKHKLHFSQDEDIVLPIGTQDILSFFFQLSQLLNQSRLMEFIELPIIDQTQLTIYKIELGKKEEISTGLGNLRTLHLRKLHNQGEPYFEIWLGLEYRMLPVKIRLVDGSEKVIEEDVIADIRASDEP